MHQKQAQVTVLGVCDGRHSLLLLMHGVPAHIAAATALLPLSGFASLTPAGRAHTTQPSLSHTYLNELLEDGRALWVIDQDLPAQRQVGWACAGSSKRWQRGHDPLLPSLASLNYAAQCSRHATQSKALMQGLHVNRRHRGQLT
jgi:hypothetical protein